MDKEKKNSPHTDVRNCLILNRSCDLGGARTLDPLIKSQLLYQLSYEVNPHLGDALRAPLPNRNTKVQLFLKSASPIGIFFRRQVIYTLPTRLTLGMTHLCTH